MEHRTRAARHALFLVAPTAKPASPANGRNIGRILDFPGPETHKAPPAVESITAVPSRTPSLQSSILATAANPFCYAPAIALMFESAAKMFASCLIPQMSLFGLMTPFAFQAPRRSSEVEVSAEVLERSMDIAIGAGTDAPVAASPESQAQAHKEMEELFDRSMEIAIRQQGRSGKLLLM
jgi:hypothetical protein